MSPGLGNVKGFLKWQPALERVTLKAMKEWKKGREELDNWKAEEREKEEEPERMWREKGEGTGEKKTCRRDSLGIEGGWRDTQFGERKENIFGSETKMTKPRHKQNLLTNLVNIY